MKALPEYCVQVKGDIDKVNAYFMQNLNQLLSRGEGADDKEDILFAAYQHVPDAEFRKYMGQKKDDYYDNINDMANADYKTIMLKAKTKYDMLLSNKDRPFGSPSEEEQHVIALQAELNEVKDSNLKLSKQLKSKLKSPAPGTNANKVTSSSFNNDIFFIYNRLLTYRGFPNTLNCLNFDIYDCCLDIQRRNFWRNHHGTCQI